MPCCADYTLAKGSTLAGIRKTKVGPEQAVKIVASNAAAGIKSTISEMRKQCTGAPRMSSAVVVWTEAGVMYVT